MRWVSSTGCVILDGCRMKGINCAKGRETRDGNSKCNTEIMRLSRATERSHGMPQAVRASLGVDPRGWLRRSTLRDWRQRDIAAWAKKLQLAGR